MDIKDISVVVDLAGTRPATRVAIDLAQKFGAHLTGITLAYDPVVPGYAVTPVPVDFMISARNQAIEEAKKAETAFLKDSAGKDITTEGRTIEVMSGGGLEGIVHDLRLADLVVIGEDDPEQPEPVRSALIEAVLFHAGAPLLVVPRKMATPIDASRVLIAWDGSITASHAVRAAMPFLKTATAVDIAIVDDGKELPTGQRVTAYLARHGINATPKTIPNPGKDVAAAIKKYAEETNTGLIVMGAYGHNRLLQWILGGATSGMLKGLRIPLIMTH